MALVLMLLIFALSVFVMVLALPSQLAPRKRGSSTQLVLRVVVPSPRLPPALPSLPSLQDVGVSGDEDKDAEDKKAAKRAYQRQYYTKNRVYLNQQAKLYRAKNLAFLKQKKNKPKRDLEREQGVDSMRQRLALHPLHSQHLLTKSQHDSVFHHILHEKQIFPGLTLAAAVASGRYTVYFGVSKVPGAEMSLNWLFPSGKTGPRCRLSHADGSSVDKTIGSRLGAQGAVLYGSRLVFNALELLWRLQETYRSLPLGTGRLNRNVGIPAYRKAYEITDDAVCSLYVTCFPVTSRADAVGTGTGTVGTGTVGAVGTGAVGTGTWGQWGQWGQ
ncbi:hypothetical protein B484DRAFT_84367 [Ochromonadaceae sp. CCMP2298]|nr:hypothetical protein B484DRAFT_84367 [Ochromonadaceae sp. CCMP2298]